MPEDAPAVFEFEGDEISEFYAQIPSTRLEGDVAYPRGTRIRMEIELRVSSVRHDENKRTGKLMRIHTLALEEARVLSAFTPAQLRAAAEAAEAQLQADAAAGVGEPYEVPELPGGDSKPIETDVDIPVDHIEHVTGGYAVSDCEDCQTDASHAVTGVTVADEPDVDFSDIDAAEEAKRVAGLSADEVDEVAAEFESEENDVDQFAPAGPGI